jgi:superfamily II DNA/RNA helicase
MPFQIEDYVHRIGRTARGGQTGSAFSFFVKKNLMLAPELESVFSILIFTNQCINIASIKGIIINP